MRIEEGHVRIRLPVWSWFQKELLPAPPAMALHLPRHPTTELPPPRLPYKACQLAHLALVTRAPFHASLPGQNELTRPRSGSLPCGTACWWSCGSHACPRSRLQARAAGELCKSRWIVLRLEAYCCPQQWCSFARWQSVGSAKCGAISPQLVFRRSPWR